MDHTVSRMSAWAVAEPAVLKASVATTIASKCLKGLLLVSGYRIVPVSFVKRKTKG